MSGALAGAFAAALAVTSLLCAPFVGRSRLAWRAAHPDQPALDAAGWRRPLWQWELLRFTCVVGSFALASFTPAPLAGIVVGVAAPSIAMRWRAETARERARAATTRLLRATEGALRSTVPLPEALRRASDATPDALARRPFSEALRSFDLGASLDEALRVSASHAVDERTRAALQTLAIGVSSRLAHDRAAQLVAAVADRLAFEDQLTLEIRARTSGLRAQVLMLALVVPAMAVYLALTVPTLAETLGSPIGRYVLVPTAVALELAGILASRRLVRAVR